jgi:hypothetical protein
MEADWEFEVGGDAPVIDAAWPGFVDLRLAPGRAWSLPEVSELQALAAALERLNAASSPGWTAKCDFWPDLEPGAVDADELDAPSRESARAMGCYIDLLPKTDRQWALPPQAAAICKDICVRLHAVSLRSCRVDLVIRQAVLSAEQEDMGITAYITACGASAQDAKLVLEAALAAFADAFLAPSTLQ